MSDPKSCPNCDTPRIGPYCHECGQKRIEPEEQRLRWFVGQLVASVTMVDRRFLGSLGLLLFRPGALDRAWIEGRRKRHLTPLSLFLVANLIYFFHPPLTDLNLSLYEQIRDQPYSALAADLVESRVAARGVDLESYARAYQIEATSVAKLLVVLHAPLLAAVLAALHLRRRMFFVEHLTVALHYWAFVLFLVMIVPAVLWALRELTGIGTQRTLQFSLAGLGLLYVTLQLRRAYAQPLWLALSKLPVVLVGIVLAHLVYRAVQFLVTFALT